MGLPMGLQYSITAIGSVILQTAVNTLGFRRRGRHDGRQPYLDVYGVPI